MNKKKKFVPLFSIITICKNSENTIAQTLESVHRQKNVENAFEHIVVDGASTDGTLRIVKRYKNIICLSEPDEGISDAFNKGIKLSSGNWLLFLNADDFFSDEHVLSRTIPLLNEKFLLAYGKVQMVNRENSKILKNIGFPGLEKMLYFRMVLPHQSMFIHRLYFEKYGVFDNNYKLGMDYELLMRGFRKEKFIFLPFPIANMREGGVSHTHFRNCFYEHFLAQKSNKVGIWFWPYFVLMFYRFRSSILRNWSATSMLTRYFNKKE